MMFSVLLLSVLAAAAAAAAAGPDPLPANDPDEVLALPGWAGALPTRLFSGYLNASATKHLHYVFVAALAPVDPATAPVVLWLNGGPGCSSLDGFFYEHGPFRLNGSTVPPTLTLFPQSWATVAHMLYLEAPVGVGFSYSDDPAADYNCTDDSAARDNLAALEAFFAKFPALRAHDLYLTGESYAGVYVPTLAEAVLHAMQAGTYTGAPLRGLAAGNGCTGTEIGVCATDPAQRARFDAEFFLGTAFVDPPLKDRIRSACPASNYSGGACTALLAEMHAALGDIDLYNVYGVCLSGSGPQRAGSGRGVFKAPYASSAASASSLGGPDACIDSILASEYVNQPAVLAALHVRPTQGRWEVCYQAPGWAYTSTRPNLPRDTYPALVANFRVVVYNGDWDACVPWTDNYAWTSGMGYKPESAWHPWFYTLNAEGETTQQVAGYAVRYASSNFTFITVKGGRHEVPETAPAQALEMITRLVSGKQF